MEAQTVSNVFCEKVLVLGFSVCSECAKKLTKLNILPPQLVNHGKGTICQKDSKHGSAP